MLNVYFIVLFFSNTQHLYTHNMYILYTLDRWIYQHNIYIVFSLQLDYWAIDFLRVSNQIPEMDKDH